MSAMSPVVLLAIKGNAELSKILLTVKAFSVVCSFHVLIYGFICL